ncbi:hypothetical protein WG909_06780 [Peptostreptococcaceae bacterium AGR-M142]
MFSKKFIKKTSIIILLCMMNICTSFASEDNNKNIKIPIYTKDYDKEILQMFKVNLGDSTGYVDIYFKDGTCIRENTTVDSSCDHCVEKDSTPSDIPKKDLKDIFIPKSVLNKQKNATYTYNKDKNIYYFYNKGSKKEIGIYDCKQKKYLVRYDVKYSGSDIKKIDTHYDSTTSSIEVIYNDDTTKKENASYVDVKSSEKIYYLEEK